MRDISVDDILQELQVKSRSEKVEKLPDMSDIDNLVKSILNKSVDENVKDKPLSLKEKLEYEQEVKIQTQTLTSQFEALKESFNVDSKAENELNKKIKRETSEIQFIKPARAIAVKYRDTTEIALSQEIQLHKEQKFDELKKLANSQHLKQDMQNITSHFGNYKMNHKSVDDGYRTVIDTDTYKELKSNRNKKVDSFILDPKKPPEHKASIAEETLNQAVAESKPLDDKPKQKIANIQDNVNDEFEYTEKSDSREILKSLISSKRTNTILTGLLAVLAIITLPMLFLTTGEGMITIFNKISFTARNFAFINVGLVALCCAFSYDVFLNALHSLSEQKHDKDILYSALLILNLTFTAVFCIAPDELTKVNVRLYTPILILLLLVNHIGKNMTYSRIIDSFKFISSSNEVSTVGYVSPQGVAEKFVAGTAASEEQNVVKNSKTGFAEGFFANAFSSDGADILSAKMTGAILPIALICFAIGYLMRQDVFFGLSVASASTLIVTGFLTAVASTLPLNDSKDVVCHFAGIMPEYKAIDNFSETNAVLINASDIFTEDACVLCGIKTFQGKRIDEAIIDAASILTEANSALKGMFLNIIGNKDELLQEVDTLVYEGTMGISAWVSERRVLIGNRALMVNHSIAVPKIDYENKYRLQGQELIYISTDGELSAAFVVQYVATNETLDIFRLLAKNDITLVLKTMDFWITNEMIERLYKVDSSQVKILPTQMHRDFDLQTQDIKSGDCGLSNNGTAFGFAVCVAVCKRLFSCIRLGSVFHFAGVASGILILIVSVLLNLPTMIAPLQILLIMGIFGASFWIYEKNMKL